MINKLTLHDNTQQNPQKKKAEPILMLRTTTEADEGAKNTKLLFLGFIPYKHPTLEMKSDKLKRRMA